MRIASLRPFVGAYARFTLSRMVRMTTAYRVMVLRALVGCRVQGICLTLRFTCGPTEIVRFRSSEPLSSQRFSSMRRDADPVMKARSSAGEHFPDTEGVGGSIPPVPTSLLRLADAL